MCVRARAGLDLDGDSALDKGDLTAVLPDLSEKLIEQVILKLDRSGTGKIS